MNRSRSSLEPGGIDRFSVAPRTFDVVLTEKGELKAAKSTDIICEVEGSSTIINLIEEGTAVEEGDLLVEIASDKIDDRILQEELKETNSIMAFETAKTELEIQRDKNASDIRKAQLEIELKQLDLDKYLLGEWEQQLKDAEINIEQATIELERRAQDFEAAKELFARKFITKTEYDEDEFRWQKAIWELDKAKKALEVLRNYTHVAELRRRESDLEEARKESERVNKDADAQENAKLRALEGKTKELAITRDQLAKLRTQKKKCRITAPTRGFVVYYNEFFGWGGNDQIKEGAEVRERQVLMQLPDTSDMIVTLRIHEAKTDRLRIGQHVVVEVEGVPGKQFTGKVTKIAVVADTQNRWLNPDLKEYETEITLDPFDEPLKPGVTAHAEILVETAEQRLAVPVQTIFTKAGRQYLFRDKAGKVESVEVQLGAVGTEWAEIVEGINEGDRILLAFMDEHKRLISDSVGVDGQSRDATRGVTSRKPPAKDHDLAAQEKANDNEAKPQRESQEQARPGGEQKKVQAGTTP